MWLTDGRTGGKIYLQMAHRQSLNERRVFEAFQAKGSLSQAVKYFSDDKILWEILDIASQGDILKFLQF